MENNKRTGYPSIDKPWLKFYSEEAIHAQVPRLKTVDFMCERNKNDLNAVALHYFGRKMTYGQVIAEIDRTASAFQNLGVKKGEIVTFCMPTVPETIYAFYGLNKIGAVAAMIDPTTNNGRIISFINKFESRLLVAIDLFAPKLKEIFEKTEVRQCITISASDSLPPILKIGYKLKEHTDAQKRKDILQPIRGKLLNWSKFQEQYAHGTVVSSDYEENYPAGIVLTSGTTGVPKGAVLSNDNLNAIAIEQGYCTNMERNDTFLNIMPPFLAYGLVCGISNVLCNGLDMYIVPKFEKRTAEDVKKQIENGETNVAPLDSSSTLDSLLVKYRPNHILGVPNFFLNLAKSEKMKDFDLSFLKSVIAGGDVLHAAIESQINDFFASHGFQSRISKGYGMTELSSVATYTTPKNNKQGSVGIPVMLNNIKILDIETGEELGYGQSGELFMTGPGMILGYYGNERDTKATFTTDKDGVRWVRTGDVFSVDEDGALFFKSRIKRMMVRSDGHNVFPGPIEEVISAHPAVRDCAVVGVKCENGEGEIPTAMLQLREGCDVELAVLEKDLTKMSLQKLPERDVALQYFVVEQIPYTFVGKVDYRKLEEIAAQKK